MTRNNLQLRRDFEEMPAAACQECAALRHQLNELAAESQETLDDYLALLTTLEADEPLQAACAENRRLQTLVRGLQSRLDGLMLEKSTIMTRYQSAQRRLALLERDGRAA